jgi:hypothetical protein
MKQMMELQRQMGGMPPMMQQQQMQQQMEMFNRLTPDERARMAREAAQARPEDISRGAEQLLRQQQQQEQYVVSASNMLKAEGNALHKRQDYKGAAEKYQRAKDNLQGGCHISRLSLFLSLSVSLSVFSRFLCLSLCVFRARTHTHTHTHRGAEAAAATGAGHGQCLKHAKGGRKGLSQATGLQGCC